MQCAYSCKISVLFNFPTCKKYLRFTSIESNSLWEGEIKTLLECRKPFRWIGDTHSTRRILLIKYTSTETTLLIQLPICNSLPKEEIGKVFSSPFSHRPGMVINTNSGNLLPWDHASDTWRCSCFSKVLDCPKPLQYPLDQTRVFL